MMADHHYVLLTERDVSLSDMLEASHNFAAMIGFVVHNMDKSSAECSSEWFLKDLERIRQNQAKRQPSDDTLALRKLHLLVQYVVRRRKDHP